LIKIEGLSSRMILQILENKYKAEY
jgi:hypothetical protein